MNKSVYIERNSKEENDYCKENNIIIEKLKNGITLLGIPRVVNDEANASIHWFFKTPVYKEPIHGANHFLEHFFNRNLRIIARENAVFTQAATSSRTVREICEGIGNIHVKDFGIWNMIPLIRKSLENPLLNSANIDEDIENERKVILTEIADKKASHDYWVDTTRRQITLLPENPGRFEAIGTEETVTSMNKSHLENALSCLNPENLIITIYTSGEKKMLSQVYKEVKNNFKDFPKRYKSVGDVDISLFEKINTTAWQKDIYTHKTHLQNKIITIQIVWHIKRKVFTPKAVALNRLNSIIDSYLLDRLRRKGLVYSAYSSINEIGEENTLLIFSLEIRKIPQIKKYVEKELKPEITSLLSSIDDKSIQNLSDLEVKKQKAYPIPTVARLDWAIDGLLDYGKMINADKVKKIFAQIEVKHFRQWLEELKTNKPIYIIVGDFDE